LRELCRLTSTTSIRYFDSSVEDLRQFEGRRLDSLFSEYP